MKKVLKWTGILLLALILIVFVFGIIVNEKKPKATPSEEADRLAEKMMASVNKTAWDTTHIIQWTFADVHHYLWDKKRHLAKVNWDKTEVLLNPETKTGVAMKDGVEMTGELGRKLVDKAWGYFLNDAFWLNPVVKAFDPGTQRSLVTLKDGREGLMVFYSSGGVTPGDSYVWILDENNRPESWKMWVKIIPIGGVETSWDGWITLETGAKVATLHKSKVFDLKITNVKAGVDFKALGIDGDPFELLE